MKTKLILSISVALALTMVMQSCSLVKNNDFAQRKYTKFKKGDNQVQIQNNEVLKQENTKSFADAKSHELIKTDEITTMEVSDIVNENPTYESINTKQVFTEFFAEKTVKQVISKNALKFTKRIASDFKGHRNTTSVGGDDQLLLLILAILLPPLAVYLVAGLGTEFWIDIILCLLFWLPGIIYAIIVVMR